MKSMVLLLALSCAITFAADDAVVASNQAASLEPQDASYGPDALTIPRWLSYQGRLTDSAGNPVPDSIYSVTYRLYTLEVGGTALWSEDRSLQTRSGLFSTAVGMMTPILSVPEDGLCYLEMQLNPGPAMTPRIKLASVPYAYLARKAETANVALSAVESPWVRGTPDSVLFTAHKLGIARGGSSNAVFSNAPESHLNLGIACTTGVQSGGMMYNTAFGYRNACAGNGGASVLGGQTNHSNGYTSLVGAGYGNIASGRAAAVVAGRSDSALGEYSAVLGGWQNLAGEDPTDTGAVVVGGRANRTIAKYGFIGGGSGNTAGGRWSTVGGGLSNYATNFYSTIGGGYSNYTNDYYASVLGGYCDTAVGNSSVVVGGAQNTVTGDYSTIAGGTGNRLTGNYSLAFGEGIVSGQSHVALFFSGADTGNLLINREGHSYDSKIIEAGWHLSNGNGAYLWSTGTWVSTSKRADWAKSKSLGGSAVLDRIAGLDIGVREYKDARGECIAPDGDEFSAALGMKPGGAEPGSGAISALDVASVSLAGVQELIRRLDAQQAEIEQLKAELRRR